MSAFKDNGVTACVEGAARLRELARLLYEDPEGWKKLADAGPIGITMFYHGMNAHAEYLETLANELKEA